MFPIGTVYGRVCDALHFKEEYVVGLAFPGAFRVLRPDEAKHFVLRRVCKCALLDLQAANIAIRLYGIGRKVAWGLTLLHDNFAAERLHAPVRRLPCISGD